MSLQAKIQDELKAAMLARDQERLSTLRMLKSALGYAQIERKNEELSDADVVALIQKEIKKRNDSADQFAKAARQELADKELREAGILQSFLPQAFSAQELDDLVRASIAETGATSKKDMGTVIKAVQTKAAGRADGKSISASVMKLLGS